MNILILFSDVYAPFTVAILAVITVGMLELLSISLSGAGVSEAAEMLVDTDSLSALTITNWLLVRGLPLSIGLLLLMAGFGTVGFLVQLFAPAPMPYVLVVALLGGYLTLRGGGKLLAPLFGTHSTAVSEQSLIGRKAKVLSPRVAQGFAGEARVVDEHGQIHAVMIEPCEGTDVFNAGDSLVLVSRLGLSRFTARRT